jgi:hypothetical protein
MITPVRNPRKAFNFLIEVMGMSFMPPFGAQEVTLPDSVVDAVEHGFGNTVLKTAGLVKPGTLKINRIISLDPTGIAALESEGFHLWQQKAQNAYAQSGGDPDDYKFTVVVKEIGNTGILSGAEPQVVATHTCIGCWPGTINGREFKRADSANLVEAVELHVDYLLPGAATTSAMPTFGT